MRQPTAAASCLGLSLTLAAGCGDAVDRRPATWGYISPAILQPNCATVSCHSTAAAAAGLDFSDPDRGYQSLTGLSVLILDPTQKEDKDCMKVGNTVACRREFRPMVVPFNPDQSRVVHMLRARNAARMPPDRPLPEPDIALIERWILNGAKKTVDKKSAMPRDAAPTDGAKSDATADAGVTVDGGTSDAANETPLGDAPADATPDAGQDG